MQKALVILVQLTLFSGILLAEGVQEEPPNDSGWRPIRPITLIVPWEEGGASDRTSRVAAELIEERLGQRILIDNRPGAAGAFGTEQVLIARADGYTWSSGVATDLANYKSLGLLDTALEEWRLYLHLALPLVAAVPTDSVYTDFGRLLTALKAEPGKIRVNAAGLGPCGKSGIEEIREHTEIEYISADYYASTPALIAALSGEIDLLILPSVDLVDMLRAGKLRALAVLSDTSLRLDGYGEIEAVSNWIPDFEPDLIHYGIFLPRGVPDKTIETLGEIWEEKIADSEALISFAAENGLLFIPAWGDEAHARISSSYKRRRIPNK